MDANQIEKLKALALAAPEYSIYQILDGISNDEYLSFIAEARPAAVLELIAEVERLRAAPAAGTVEKDAADETSLEKIRSAIADYYRALNARQHGEVAMDRAFRAIEREAGMSWDHTKAGKANA